LRRGRRQRAYDCAAVIEQYWFGWSGFGRNTFEKAGMRVVYKIDQEIHDRSFILDNGFVFKLGRGLDIYKPAAGLAAHDPSLRPVRRCEIDVFEPAAT
jgi:hypothetical protein